MNIFDAETAPDREKALALMPPFDEKDVKLGNLKDPTKISEKISEARASHESDWLEKAALRPETANILAIGLHHVDKGIDILHINDMGSEKAMLQGFWERFQEWHAKTGKVMAGHNIFLFDMPMLELRSRILGVPVPGGIRKGRYWDSARLHDLRDDFLLGRNPLEFKSSLDHIAKSFGLPGKNGHGKDFAETYARNPNEAIKYLINDLFVTKAVAEKLGHNCGPTCATFEEFSAKYLQPEQKPAPDDLF